MRLWNWNCRASASLTKQKGLELQRTGFVLAVALDLDFMLTMGVFTVVAAIMLVFADSASADGIPALLRIFCFHRFSFMQPAGAVLSPTKARCIDC